MATVFQTVSIATDFEALAQHAAEERAYHIQKFEHYCGLAVGARQFGSMAEVIAFERMADRHRILALS